MKSSVKTKKWALRQWRALSPVAPTDLKAAATRNIVAALNGVLADVVAMDLKTKNLRWHMSGLHFRDYQLLPDEQADQRAWFLFEAARPGEA